MPPKKRSRSNPEADEVGASQEVDAVHSPTNITTTTTTTSSSSNGNGRKSKTDHESGVSGLAHGGSGAATGGAAAESRQKLPADLEGLVLRSSVIAPDVVGIRCVAVHPGEREMVVVRENGSMILYSIESFQNVPHFQQIRHTGGRANRTITRVRYLPCVRSTFAASYLSGQLVVYCGQTLAPLHVQQRTGGAIWDFCIAGPLLYAAVADGSWQQLRMDCDAAVPTLSLERIIPKVSGADRALSVCCSQKWGIAAGTDDAGNVMAWRIPHDGAGEAGNSSGTRGARPSGLSDHEALWTSRLPKGMGICSAISGAGCSSSASSGGNGPVVAVGTTMGDIVLFDARHGHAIKTFTHHKGPISTLVSSSGEDDGAVLYASGWHESLRSYRCDTDGEWYPAEVKRRTHYHEASELLVLQQHQLILSAARDGTIMYAPLASVFTSPTMYVSVTTQQFAFAKAKNVLLHSRHGRIEGFRTDAALRHWAPLFAHKVHGRFHLQGLWCDEQLHYILFATDERAALLRVCWRDGAEDALALHRIEEAVSLPAGRGVLDCCFVPHSGESAAATATTGSCYVLLDNAVLHITLGEGYPVVSTALHTDGGEGNSDMRPTQLLVGETGDTLVVCGLRGRLTCSTAADGTIDPSSFVWKREPTRMAAAVPTVHLQQHEKMPLSTIVALTNDGRYVAGLDASTPCLLPRTLPHDTRFIARLPPLSSGEDDADGTTATKRRRSALRFLAVFSRGLLYVTESTWHMVNRCTVEAAFVLQDNERVLLLQRNLEGTLEALPLCWKVRRFGN
ncbi:putative aminopeptidase, putative,metallo-peptidase, Clan MG, Family M24 [Trypanosoma grayi]|uniref:putative aminopeptidase, putative,metallo-peptidase, Clan MG, Family M24 n=1 Tax=Trypanosoma grayi TaxID=71804 RepID=UPI0004F42DDF|nr:putative aminopeptidase, putative,metallo-peptidase, Clan MG, Family M24 [Trypanosoma grayi]KEG10764.1 putative aminopeptidase, putative,metallo-peptidase, Clan MG, Family M24 [Trypanosoma grayi]